MTLPGQAVTGERSARVRARHVVERVVVETCVAAVFVVLAAAAVTGPAWLLVVAFAAHGIKDLWQHRRQFVAGTRWWPPFCLAVDALVAMILLFEIAAGVRFNG
jgi:hypothetical protein